jgi:ubiquinone/menaquinone biosynthesis C-methylase UbiE
MGDDKKPNRPLEEMFAVLGGVLPRSALEVGFRLGDNLAALKPRIEKLYGVEPDLILLEKARLDPRLAGVELMAAEPQELPFASASLDFVFTSGLLAQVALKDVMKICAEVVRVSRQYVACIEKSNLPQDALQPSVGKFCLDHFSSLEMVAGGSFAVPGAESETINWWVFRKQANNAETVSE